MTSVLLSALCAFVLLFGGSYAALRTDRGALGGLLVCAASAVAVVAAFYMALSALF